MEHQQAHETNDVCRLPALCGLVFASLLIVVFLSQSYLSLPIILPLLLFMEGKEMNGATKPEPFDLGLYKCGVVKMVTAI